MSYKLKQLEAKIHLYIAEIITTEINNELANKASITHVKLSNDKSIVKVYVNFISKSKQSLEELKKTTSYIKLQLAKNLNIRRTPEIRFELDDNLEKINYIEDLIKKVN